MNRYRLVHSTEFIYDGPVYESYNEVRLRPIHDDHQSCISFRLVTQPSSRGASFKDGYGNWAHQFNILPNHRHLRVEAESVVLVHEVPEPQPGGMSLSGFDEVRRELAEENYDWIAPSAYVPRLPALGEICLVAEQDSDGTVASFAQRASDFIHRTFTYQKGATHVHSSAADALALRAGVCQDFAHVLIGVLRFWGLPARYISGYLVPGAAANPDAKQEEVIGGQASHAWVEVFLPDSGWIGFDPTLGKPVGFRHIRVACGRDYGDVPPLRGVYKGHAGQRLSVDVRVRPALDEGGCETLSETCAAPEEVLHSAELPQQAGQQ
jgi:transglutaminase-like putative cysteine protease